MASPAGETSLENGSNKSMPERDYALKFYDGTKWHQPGIDWEGTKLQGKDRQIRFHPGKNAAWTQGCYVFLDENAGWDYGKSEAASRSFDKQMGAEDVIYFKGPKGDDRIGAVFTNPDIRYRAFVNRLAY
jgi:hypothetical protein